MPWIKCNSSLGDCPSDPVAYLSREFSCSRLKGTIFLRWRKHGCDISYNLCNILHLLTIYIHITHLIFAPNLCYLPIFVFIKLTSEYFFLFWGNNANRITFFFLNIYCWYIEIQSILYVNLLSCDFIELNISRSCFCRFLGIFYVNNSGDSFFLSNLHAFYFLFLLSRTSSSIRHCLVLNLRG